MYTRSGDGQVSFGANPSRAPIVWGLKLYISRAFARHRGVRYEAGLSGYMPLVSSTAAGRGYGELYLQLIRLEPSGYQRPKAKDGVQAKSEYGAPVNE